MCVCVFVTFPYGVLGQVWYHRHTGLISKHDAGLYNNELSYTGSFKKRILGECLLISSLPGTALGTLVDIRRLAGPG